MRITVGHTIEAPLDRTFATFTDLEGAPDRISGIKRLEVLTDGPMEVGTRFRETRVFFNKEATEEMTVTSFKPDESYTVEASSCGCEYITEFRFAPLGSERTHIELDMRSRPLTFMAYLMLPMAYLMAPMMKKCFAKDMEDLRAHLQASS